MVKYNIIVKMDKICDKEKSKVYDNISKLELVLIIGKNLKNHILII